jgi:hypothetical protein
VTLTVTFGKKSRFSVRENKRLLVHKDKCVRCVPVQARMLVAAMQRLDPERYEGSELACQLHEWKRSAPFVATLLAVPLMSHQRCDFCPGYPRRDASFLGNHRPYNRGQLLNFLGRPSAYDMHRSLQTLSHCIKRQNVTSFAFGAMDQVVSVAVTAITGGSPKPLGYRIPRVAKFSDSSSKAHFNNRPSVIHLSTHVSKSSSSRPDQGPCLATGSQTRRI